MLVLLIKKGGDRIGVGDGVRAKRGGEEGINETYM